MWACIGSFQGRQVLCTIYASQRFVSSGFLCGESCGSAKVGMIISVTVFHFVHIKVTVGDVRVGGGFCAELPLENTGLFGFYVCITRLELPSAEQERVPKPEASSEEEGC